MSIVSPLWNTTPLNWYLPRALFPVAIFDKSIWKSYVTLVDIFAASCPFENQSRTIINIRGPSPVIILRWVCGVLPIPAHKSQDFSIFYQPHHHQDPTYENQDWSKKNFLNASSASSDPSFIIDKMLRASIYSNDAGELMNDQHFHLIEYHHSMGNDHLLLLFLVLY